MSRLILRRDPYARVTDWRSPGKNFMSLPSVDFRSSPFRRELHGIRWRNFEEDLFDLALIADEVAKTLVHGEEWCWRGGRRARARTSGRFLTP